PEQVRGEKLDARTDLFSFGLVLYEMATGRRAFPGPTAALVHEAILTHTPPAVHDLNAAVPPGLEAIISGALQKDRLQRFQSAAEIRERLQHVRRDVGRVRTAYTRWAVTVAAAATLVVLAVAAWTGLASSRHRFVLLPNDTVVLANITNETGDPAF